MNDKQIIESRNSFQHFLDGLDAVKRGDLGHLKRIRVSVLVTWAHGLKRQSRRADFWSRANEPTRFHLMPASAEFPKFVASSYCAEEAFFWHDADKQMLVIQATDLKIGGYVILIDPS